MNAASTMDTTLSTEITSTTSLTEVTSTSGIATSTMNATSTAEATSLDRSPPIMGTEKPCLLLELAAELRNTIYRYALVTESEDPVKLRPRAALLRQSLLNACTQIRKEARPIFWAENSFLLCGVRERDIEEAGDVLSLAGPKLCCSITRLVVRWRLEDLPRVQLGIGLTLEWFLERRGTWVRASEVARMLHGGGLRFESVVAEEPEPDTDFYKTLVKSSFEETYHKLNTKQDSDGGSRILVVDQRDRSGLLESVRALE